MDPNRSRVYKTGAAILLICIFLGFLFLSSSKTVLKPVGDNNLPGAGSLPSHAVAVKIDPTLSFLDAFKSTITLYGIVKDQHGKAVQGAKIELTPVDTPWGDESRSKVTLMSDAEGKFSVTGLTGAYMGVQASKQGYMEIPPLDGPSSSSMVDYMGGAESGQRHSNSATPLILTLLDIGVSDPIFYMKETPWKLPFDGTVHRIALDSESGEGPHVIEFYFKSDCLTLPKGNASYGIRFDWSLDARIPGGGFVWIENSYNFEAPESGYKESIHLAASASQPVDKWQRSKSGRYFVKFADGSYARLLLEVDGDTQIGESAITMTTWLNLKPGSRNIASLKGPSFGYQETDPEKD